MEHNQRTLVIRTKDTDWSRLVWTDADGEKMDTGPY